MALTLSNMTLWDRQNDTHRYNKVTNLALATKICCLISIDFFQDLKRYFGIWMRHQSHLSQASSSSIFLISTDKFNPGERDWGEQEAEPWTYNINFKQNILASYICVIHPVKKSKIWLRKINWNNPLCRLLGYHLSRISETCHDVTRVPGVERSHHSWHQGNVIARRGQC